MDSFARKALIAISLAALVGATLLFLWSVVDLLLLFFSGVLLALLIRMPAGWIERHTRLRTPWSSLLVALTGLLLLAGLGFLFAPQFAAQAQQVQAQLPQLLMQTQETLLQYSWGRALLDGIPTGEEFSFDTVLSGLQAVLTPTFTFLSGAFLALIIGFYLSLRPSWYLDAAFRIVPPHARRRARNVHTRIDALLRYWLLGRLAGMLLIGALATVGLLILDVPLAVPLGILAGLLEFVPYIGPVLSAVPAVLVALAQSPTTALYVLVLYVLIQAIEGYALGPYIDRKTVQLPPALTIIFQVAMGAFFGIAGLFLATPILVVAVTLIDSLYVQPMEKRERRR